jgi:hypothetical protein
MQPLARTSSAGTSYTAAQVQAMLFGPSLQMRWLFDLLGPGLTPKGDLTPYVLWSESGGAHGGSPPQITHDSNQAVKRKLTFTMRVASSLGINVLRDLVRVRYQILAPDGSWLEWVVGIFAWTPPSRVIQEGITYWSASCPDLSQLLSNESLEVSTSVTGGTSYAAGVAKFVGLVTATPLQTLLLDQGQVLANGLSWTAGTDSALKAINDLLAAVVYTSAYMKGNVLTARPYPDFTQEPVAMLLDTVNGQAQVLGPFGDTPDYSKALFNVFRVTGSDPRSSPVFAEYVNNRADSPTSVASLGQRYVKYINDSKITNNGTAHLRAKREAQAAARIYSTLQVGLPPFPLFDDLDVMELVYQSQDEGLVDQNYLVLSWTHTCSAAAATTISLQRVVAA